MTELVTSNWLNKNIFNPSLVIFDCSWYMPNVKINPLKDYKKEHIIGAYFFNLDKIKNLNSLIPNGEKSNLDNNKNKK